VSGDRAGDLDDPVTLSGVGNSIHVNIIDGTCEPENYDEELGPVHLPGHPDDTIRPP
jgi:hypothetical protein